MGVPLPETDHVVHYCKPTSFDEDGELTSVAFRPRPVDDYMSGDWLEYHTSQQPESSAIDGARRSIGRRLGLRPGGRLAVLNVADIGAAGRSIGCSLTVESQPAGPDDEPSHTGIGRYGHKGNALALKLKRIVLRLHLAVDGREGPRPGLRISRVPRV